MVPREAITRVVRAPFGVSLLVRVRKPGMTVRARDASGDAGPPLTGRSSARGLRVGTPAKRRIRRFARDPRLDRLLLELYRGFGPQEWWPAATPFEVIVGAILTQNTAWTNVEKAIAGLAPDALTPARIVALRPDDLARRIRPAGYFRAKAKKLREISQWYLDAGGLRALRERPLAPLRAELLTVWGVGPETADSILCYAAGRRSSTPTPVASSGGGRARRFRRFQVGDHNTA